MLEGSAAPRPSPLAGHYGGARHWQRDEFESCGGAVLATTNCILIPRPTYADGLFSTRFTAVPGGTRLATGDFSAVIISQRFAF